MTEYRVEDYDRLIDKLARRAYRRVAASGATNMDLADIRQEMRLTFVVAARRYDPENRTGAAFETFLTRAIWNNWNRLMDQQGSASARESSLDRTMGDGESTMLDVLRDNEPDAETLAVERETRERILQGVSPLTRRVIELLETPHPLLMGELLALRDHKRMAARRGVGTQSVPGDYGINLILRALGVGRRQRVRVREEIKALVGIES